MSEIASGRSVQRSPKFELKGAILVFFHARSSNRRASYEENTNLTLFDFEFQLFFQRLRVGKILVQYSFICSLVIPACSPNWEHFSMYSSIEQLSKNSPSL